MVSQTTDNILFPTNYHCATRNCRNCKVEIIKTNGIMCQLISQKATNAKNLNRSSFSYDRNLSYSIPFLLKNECDSAYVFTQGNHCKFNVFANGFIDLIPHLASFLNILNWTPNDLFAYKMMIDNDEEYMAIDDPDTDHQFDGLDFKSDEELDSDDDENDNDNVDNGDDENPIKHLIQSNCMRSYGTVILAQMLCTNFMEDARRDGMNRECMKKIRYFQCWYCANL